MGLDYTTLMHDLMITLPATLTGLAALIGSLRNSRKIDRNTKITQERADEVVKKVEVVHELTNGNTKAALEMAKQLAYETGRKDGIRSASDHNRRLSDRKAADR